MNLFHSLLKNKYQNLCFLFYQKKFWLVPQTLRHDTLHNSSVNVNALPHNESKVNKKSFVESEGLTV